MRQQDVIERGITWVNEQNSNTKRALCQLESALQSFDAPLGKENVSNVDTLKVLLHEFEDCHSALARSIDLISDLLGFHQSSFSFTTHEKVGNALSLIIDYCDAYNETVENGEHSPNSTTIVTESAHISEMRRNASSSMNDWARVTFRRNNRANQE